MGEKVADLAIISVGEVGKLHDLSLEKVVGSVALGLKFSDLRCIILGYANTFDTVGIARSIFSQFCRLSPISSLRVR